MEVSYCPFTPASFILLHQIIDVGDLSQTSYPIETCVAMTMEAELANPMQMYYHLVFTFLELEFKH